MRRVAPSSPGGARPPSPAPHAVGAAAVAVVVAAGCATAGTFPPGTLVGGCGPAPGLEPRYVLPFTPGETYELTQGNCGEESHDGRFRYGFDFRMPVGTPVVAARDGIVHTVRDDRPDGTRRVGDENFVFIWHEGNVLSRYLHLRQGGATVWEGKRVSAGDTIGYSGNSGRSAFPHLHFDVADRCGEDGCRTTPSAFRNADPAIPRARGIVTARASPPP